MTNSNHLVPCAPFFAQLNILVIFKVNFLYIPKFMFSCRHRFLPSPALSKFFFWLVAKFIIMIPEPQLIFDLIPAQLIS